MKSKRSSYDYGDCHVCGEGLEASRVNQDFWVKGKLIVVADVPAGVCPQCGEKVVTAEVGRSLAAHLVEPGRLRQARTMSVPVIRFAKKIA